MYWSHIEDQWGTYKSAIRVKWPLLSDGEMHDICGSRELLILSLQRHYGYTRREALSEIETLIRHLEKNPAQLSLRQFLG